MKITKLGHQRIGGICLCTPKMFAGGCNGVGIIVVRTY